MFKLRTGTVVSIAVLVSACASKTDESPASAQQPAEPQSPSVTTSAAAKKPFAAFEVRWERPKAGEVRQRLQRVAEVLAGASLSNQPFAEQVPEHTDDPLGFAVPLDAVGAAGEALSVRYYSQADDLRVSNARLQDDITSPTDVGASVARTIFEQTLKKLADSGLVNATDFDLSQVQESKTTTVLESSISSTDRVEVVNSYDFLAQRVLNGIPFVNAGIQVSVHRGGRIARIRMGGARPMTMKASDSAAKDPGSVRTQSAGAEVGNNLVDIPTGAGFVFSGAIDKVRYETHFKRTFTNGLPDKAALMYMLPMSQTARPDATAVLEPMYVFSFSSKYGESASRRRYVGYSLRDPSAPPTELSEKAEPEATGDKRP